MNNNNTEKTPDEIVEFLPDALEIKNQKLPLAIKIGIWFPFIALTGAIIWASIAKTDVVIQGGGKLVSESPTIVMKPLERSVIEKVHIKIGDVVKKDQILITFDPTINMAEGDRLLNEIHALEAQLARLQAEFDGKNYTGGSDQFSKWQQSIFKQRNEYYKQRILN